MVSESHKIAAEIPEPGLSPGTLRVAHKPVFYPCTLHQAAEANSANCPGIPRIYWPPSPDLPHQALECGEEINTAVPGACCGQGKVTYSTSFPTF